MEKYHVMGMNTIHNSDGQHREVKHIVNRIVDII